MVDSEFVLEVYDHGFTYGASVCLAAFFLLEIVYALIRRFIYPGRDFKKKDGDL